LLLSLLSLLALLLLGLTSLLLLAALLRALLLSFLSLLLALLPPFLPAPLRVNQAARSRQRYNAYHGRDEQSLKIVHFHWPSPSVFRTLFDSVK
jgi:hypothetical protein